MFTYLLEHTALTTSLDFTQVSVMLSYLYYFSGLHTDDICAQLHSPFLIYDGVQET